MMKYDIPSERAIELAKTSWWKGENDFTIAKIQMHVKQLSMDFSAFHKAIETALGRPVWTHEFAHTSLFNEYKYLHGESSQDDIMCLFEHLEMKYGSKYVK